MINSEKLVALVLTVINSAKLVGLVLAVINSEKLVAIVLTVLNSEKRVALMLTVINSEKLATLVLTAEKGYTTSLPPSRRLMRFVCKMTIYAAGADWTFPKEVSLSGPFKLQC